MYDLSFCKHLISDFFILFECFLTFCDLSDELPLVVEELLKLYNEGRSSAEIEGEIIRIS